MIPFYVCGSRACIMLSIRKRYGEEFVLLMWIALVLCLLIHAGIQIRHLALLLLSLCKLSPLPSLTYWAGLRKTQGSTHKLQCWGLLWRLAKISTQNCRRHTYTNSLACELYQPHPTLNTAILNFVFLVTWIIFVWGTTSAPWHSLLFVF